VKTNLLDLGDTGITDSQNRQDMLYKTMSDCTYSLVLVLTNLIFSMNLTSFLVSGLKLGNVLFPLSDLLLSLFLRFSSSP
jgi:hypothetical protein